ncbi:hypothetical protein HOU03_gp539 [Caulobacter phage CcrSC]|uniref:Uncharacterized protein n=1 Tax=Caulobacter phage CcrSC TaxID=2283272 RepID=A0A385EFY1_9CAUD|nr:hypothetical protein HOU03_gp539 [Caulobacter phage CcrSC]AXQ69728.1 hypothetical protein CcrSC_gp146c [Caulobacter phage CcrSC]
MSRHTILLTQADAPYFQWPIINPDGQKIVDVVTGGDEAGIYAAQIAGGQEVGDELFIRLHFNINAPNGQAIKLAGISMEDRSVPNFVINGNDSGVALGITKDNDASKVPIAIFLKSTGRDWLVVSHTRGIELVTL